MSARTRRRGRRTRWVWLAVLALVAGVAPTGISARAQEAPTPPSDGAGASLTLTADGGIEIGAEIESRRTETSRTYETNLPGVFRTVQYPSPVNYQDETGAWHDIDTSLAADAEGDLQVAGSATDLEISAVAGPDGLVSLGFPEGGSVEFGLEGAPAVPAEVDAATASFDGVAPDTSIELTALGSGVKESIVLASPDAPRRFEFPVTLDGVIATVEPDGSVAYRDAAGELVALTPHGYLVDAQGAQSQGVSYSLVGDAGAPTLVVDLDDTWLSDPTRAYPVIVDPTTYTQPFANFAADADDTYVVDGETATDHSSESTLRVGDDGSGAARSYLHFTELDEFIGTYVLQARLDLYQSDGNQCWGPNLEAYRVADDWSGDEVTTFPGPVTDPTDDALLSRVDAPSFASGTSCSSAGTTSIMLTRGAWNWTEHAEDWANQGVMLRAEDEASTEGYREFASADDPTNPPALDLIWVDLAAMDQEQVPAMPSQVSPSGIISTDTPTLSGLYLDAQGDTGHVEYFVFNPQNYYWGFAPGSEVESGQASEVPDAGPIPTNLDLVARAVAKEGPVTTSSEIPPTSLMSDPWTFRYSTTQLTSPEDRALVIGETTVAATAPSTLDSHPGLTLDRVEFSIDGQMFYADEEAPFEMTGDSSNTWNGDHTLSAIAYYGENDEFAAPSAERVVTISNPQCPDDDAVEDDDDSTEATPMPADVVGTLCADDPDWFEVELDEGDPLEATLEPSAAPGDVQVTVHSETEVVATSDTDEESGLEEITYEAPAAGTYFVEIAGSTSTVESSYLLEASTPELSAEAMAGTPSVVINTGADPSIVRYGERYFAVTTNAVGDNIPIWVTTEPTNPSTSTSTSEDKWRWGGEVLPTTGDGLDDTLVWAPTIGHFGNRWVLYYAAKETGTGRQCVGYAYHQNETPIGNLDRDGNIVPGSAFRNARKVICHSVGGTIDPQIFWDNQGRAWLLIKNEGNTPFSTQAPAIWIVRLDRNGLPTTTNTSNFQQLLQYLPGSWEQSDAGHDTSLVENGALIQTSAGRTFLFYSGNDFNSLRYGTGLASCTYAPTDATSPIGSCTRHSSGNHPWLGSNGYHACEDFATTGGSTTGPGGLSTFQDERGTFWAAYHVRNLNVTGHPRAVAIGKIRVDQPSGSGRCGDLSAGSPWLAVTSTASPTDVVGVGVLAQPVIADMDGDGEDEVTWARPNNSPSYDLRWEGYPRAGANPDGNWHTLPATDVPAGAEPVVGDFDDDGLDDILLYKESGDEVVWYGERDGTRVIRNEGDFIGSGFQVRAGDFDADGNDDVLVYKSGVATGVHRGRTRSLGFDSRQTDLFGSSGDGPASAVPFVGDFAGGPKSDIVWRTSSGLTLWKLTTGGRTTTLVTLVGSQDVNDIPVVGRYGSSVDEFDDLYFPTSGHIYRGLETTPFETVYDAGPASRSVASGDFDGDGTDDLVIFGDGPGSDDAPRVAYGDINKFPAPAPYRQPIVTEG